MVGTAGKRVPPATGNLGSNPLALNNPSTLRINCSTVSAKDGVTYDQLIGAVQKRLIPAVVSLGSNPAACCDATVLLPCRRTFECASWWRVLRCSADLSVALCI